MTQQHDTTSKPRRTTPRAKAGQPLKLWRIEHCQIDQLKARIQACEEKMAALADKPCAPPHVGRFYGLAMEKIDAERLIKKEQERVSLWLMLNELNELARKGLDTFRAQYKQSQAFKEEYPDPKHLGDYLMEIMGLYRELHAQGDDLHIDVWDFFHPSAFEQAILPIKPLPLDFGPCPNCGTPLTLQGVFVGDTYYRMIEMLPHCPVSGCSIGYENERMLGFQIQEGC